jgi:hypothetical protein
VPRDRQKVFPPILRRKYQPGFPGFLTKFLGRFGTVHSSFRASSQLETAVG